VYCEIVLYHKKRADASKLAEILQQAGCGNPLRVSDAYNQSSVYTGKDPYGSVFAHDAGQHCFAILQKTNGKQSTFHFESDPHTSVKTLLESVEDYARTLRDALRSSSAPRSYRVSRMIIRPFEANFEESGFEGNLFTLRQTLRDANLFHEIGTKLVTLFTTFLLVWLGLTTEKTKAAGWTFAIAASFAVVELLLAWRRGRGTISWKRR
jgi:hypothetical protein